MSDEERTLNAAQQRIVSFPRYGGASLFVAGLPGTGKSTALMARLATLLREGRRPYEILVLTPQRAQAERYEAALALLDAPTRGGADVVTFYALCRRAVSLFWPLVAHTAGFGQPEREPVFLTLETAQYYMWRVVEPLVREQGYFRDLAIPRGRLLSQLIDNLNKSALVGFAHTDIYARLKGAWTGSSDHLYRYVQAQDCATRFRALCLEHNLLDFSLATEVFCRYLLPNEVYQRHLQGRYRHLIVDNIEENVPVAQDLVAWMLGHCQSAVLAYDEGGGHRLFLGADAEGGRALAARCGEQLRCDELLQPTQHLLALADALGEALQAPGPAAAPQGDVRRARVVSGGGEQRYWISMIRWAAARIAELVQGGAPAEQIAIVAPYVSEVMRFAIQEELAQVGIGLRLLRPATPLREDALIRGLLVLAYLAHPAWEIHIHGEPYALPVEDVALALSSALAELDPVRARLLAEAALSAEGRGLANLSGGAGGRNDADWARLWARVGFQVREPYETLRTWLDTYRAGAPAPLHVMLARLFGDLLSRPGFRYYRDPGAARAYGRLVESAAKFTDAVARPGPDESSASVAGEYAELMMAGIASAEYLMDWPQLDEGEGVLLAPAYAYITRDVRSDYQFWIDLGADGWWDRPNQPLTQPYILSRHWPVGRPWRDIEEEAVRRAALRRVLTALAARCHKGLYLAFSQLGLDGNEQRGRLQTALLPILTRMRLHDG